MLQREVANAYAIIRCWFALDRRQCRGRKFLGSDAQPASNGWLAGNLAPPAEGTRLIEIGCGTGDSFGKSVDDDGPEITGLRDLLERDDLAKRSLPQVEFVS